MTEITVNDLATRYWQERQDALYYQAVRVLAAQLGKHANSVIDVGSCGCPYLDWFPAIEKKTSVDLSKPYEAPGVSSVTSDFLAWQPDGHYDLVLCLQVLEHVPDAQAFAQKLLSTGKTVIASVPYKWEKDRTPSHVHDPVDEIKMLKWFGREPNYSYNCREITSGVRRLIHVYDHSGFVWKSLKQRDQVIDGSSTTRAPETSAAKLAARKSKKPRKASLRDKLRRLASSAIAGRD